MAIEFVPGNARVLGAYTRVGTEVLWKGNLVRHEGYIGRLGAGLLEQLLLHGGRLLEMLLLKGREMKLHLLLQQGRKMILQVLLFRVRMMMIHLLLV